MLDHRSAALNSLPAAQRKDVEELKETLARQQEEHRGKELRLRLTVISLPLISLTLHTPAHCTRCKDYQMYNEGLSQR